MPIKKVSFDEQVKQLEIDKAARVHYIGDLRKHIDVKIKDEIARLRALPNPNSDDIRSVPFQYVDEDKILMDRRDAIHSGKTSATEDAIVHGKNTEGNKVKEYILNREHKKNEGLISDIKSEMRHARGHKEKIPDLILSNDKLEQRQQAIADEIFDLRERTNIPSPNHVEKAKENLEKLKLKDEIKVNREKFETIKADGIREREAIKARGIVERDRLAAIEKEAKIKSARQTSKPQPTIATTQPKVIATAIGKVKQKIGTIPNAIGIPDWKETLKKKIDPVVQKASAVVQSTKNTAQTTQTKIENKIGYSVSSVTESTKKKAEVFKGRVVKSEGGQIAASLAARIEDVGRATTFKAIKNKVKEEMPHVRKLIRDKYKAIPKAFNSMPLVGKAATTIVGLMLANKAIRSVHQSYTSNTQNTPPPGFQGTYNKIEGMRHTNPRRQYNSDFGSGLRLNRVARRKIMPQRHTQW